MDSTSFEGFVLDPSKCSKLSMEEKRELVYEISKWPNGAPELLQSWSRQEILQILCAEMGKERKYTGLTKLKIIEHLLKIVSEKKFLDLDSMTDLDSQPSSGQRTAKRQRKDDHPNRIPVASNNVSINVVDNGLCCKNSACKAKLSFEDKFCKRCSCCICFQYDDNKDPSLWLNCSSEAPFQGNSCGFSCHLECALKNEKSGIAKDGQESGLDGSFYCVSCGKMNDLLGCWRKQMLTARDTRRVDILCYRVSLGQKLLSGTKHYHNLYEIVDEAMKKLEEDVGPLTGLPVKKARGIVNRLSSGQEVQRLCAFALETLELMNSETGFKMSPDSDTVAPRIRFEDVCTSSLTVILGAEYPSSDAMCYTFWYRKADDVDYPTEPTCTLFAPSTRFSLSGLSPATNYLLKVVSFDNTRELGMCEIQFKTRSASDILEVKESQSPGPICSSLSNPSSVEDENNNVIAYRDETENQKDDDNNNNGIDDNNIIISSADLSNSVPKLDAVNLENGQTENDMECVPFVGTSRADLPNTPCKLENCKEGPGKKTRPELDKGDLESGPHDGSSSKKKDDRDLGYYVKVIRWLECDGHIETGFRQKFLTWYSMRATQQEVRIVKVFVDTLIEDPASLAGQLVDTFSEIISNKRSSVVPLGFCLKLWH